MKKGNCVAFIGAGVSAPAIRTWPEVLDKLKTHEDLQEIKHQITELLESSDDSEASLFDREAAAEMIQSKLVQSKLDDEEFRKALKDALERKDPEGSKKVKERYKLIREMPFHSLITTNFDNHLPGKTLDKANFSKLLREPFRGWIDSIKNPKRLNDFIIKLHGDIEQNQSRHLSYFLGVDTANYYLRHRITNHWYAQFLPPRLLFSLDSHFQILIWTWFELKFFQCWKQNPRTT